MAVEIAEQALKRLLMKLFSASGLRRWLYSLPGGPSLVDELPGEGTAPEEIVYQSVRELIRHGMVTPSFFEALRAARCRRAEDINAVAMLWQGGAGKGAVTQSELPIGEQTVASSASLEIKDSTMAGVNLVVGSRLQGSTLSTQGPVQRRRSQ